MATIALCTLPAAHGQLVYTTFDIPSGSPTVGQFPTGPDRLRDPSSLDGGSGNNFAYAYRSFTPSVTGSYTMGMTDGSYDPVMILYSGQTSFPVADASVGVIDMNDDGAWDYNGGTFFFGTQVVNPSAGGGGPNLMPLLRDMNLTAGTDYLVAISSYLSIETGGPSPIPLPAEFFVAGPAAVTVAPVPEPSTVALAAIGLAGAGLAFRRRQLARRTSQAAAS